MAWSKAHEERHRAIFGREIHRLDGDTGFFYARDTQAKGNQIQDALCIYNVDSVKDRDKPSVIKIGWSKDSQKVILHLRRHLLEQAPYANYPLCTK
jgi:hypothetical protein